MLDGLPARVARRLRRHPILVDTALAMATVSVSLALGHQEQPAGMRPFDLLGYALTCLASLTLVFRRRWPGLVCVGYCVAWAAYVAVGYWPVVNSAGAMLALYTVAAHRPARVAVAAVALFDLVWMYAGLRGEETSTLALLSQVVVWPAVICWFGSRTRKLAQRTAQLKREQIQSARRAVSDERLRIARELHDVVAHHMAVVSVQAGLAWYVLDSDRDTARSALGAVLETSGQAQEEMRRMLSLLRDGPPGSTAGAPLTAPGIDALATLVDRVRAAGLPVETTVLGTPRPLPRGIDACAYRVVQEVLTNILKHTDHAPTTITVRYETERVVVSVRDAGPALPPRTPEERHSGGHGLPGMRERAALYDGTLTAGPDGDGGFEVLLTLPTRASVVRRG